MIETSKLDWKKYEEITKYIYEILGRQDGVIVKGYGSNCKALGKSGLSHQIDVITSHTDGSDIYDTAIECKYRKEKVNKEVVMKLVQVLEDTGISKGIIVSRSGFTREGTKYAKFKNIGVVQLREHEEKDLNDTPNKMDIGTINLNIKIRRTGPEISSIDIGDNRKIDIKHEFDYFAFTVMLDNGSQIPLYKYVNDFQMEVNRQNSKAKPVTKKYSIPRSKLFNRQSKETINLDEIIFTGKITESDDNRNLQFNIVDKVWLIMKSIVEERTFSFSDNGAIVERKKSGK